MALVRATKKQAKLRLALEAPAGFGKTMTALKVARYLAGPNGKIAYLDTEAGSASKYAHLFEFDTFTEDDGETPFSPPFDPRRIVDAIDTAVAEGCEVFVVDSLSHFWEGKGGMLDIVDQVARTKYRGDSHRAWKEGGEIEQAMKDAILRSPIHVIACMRTKTDTVRETVTEGDRERTRIRKAGTKTIQREGLDYEFDLVGRFDVPTVLTVTKTRVDTLPPETVIDKPGEEFAETLKAWLESGATNDAIELPDAKDKKRLADVVKKLAKLDPSKDWDDMAERASRNDFGHGTGALTKPELDQLVASMGKYADTLEADLKAAAASDQAQALVGAGAEA